MLRLHNLKVKMGGVIRILWPYSNSWRICFLRIMNFLIVHTMSRRSPIPWVWITRAYTLTLIIIFCTERITKIWRVVRFVMWIGNKNKNKISCKILWYFLVIPRSKHMSRNAEHGKSLMLHADERISDDMLRHLPDSSQWQMVDSKYPIFGGWCKESPSRSLIT